MMTQRLPATVCVVDRAMNDHGGLTLAALAGSQTFQVVEYATADIRQTLSNAAHGTVVSVGLEPIASRGDAWRVCQVDERTSETTTQTLVTPATHGR